MSAIDIIALVLAVWVFVEFFVWLVKPGWVISLAEAVYARPYTAQVVFLLLGAGLLYVLLQQFTIVEVMAVTFFGATISGVAMLPFGPQLLDTLESKMEDRRFMREFALVWAVWMILSLWTLYELFA